MRVYIAGPMTGIPQYNFPAFDALAARLRRYDYEVVSPTELDDPEDRAMAMASPDGAPGSVSKSWGDFLARDIKLIADGGIDLIVVLPGWQDSRGARLETYVGNALCGVPVFLARYDRSGWPVLDMVPPVTLIRAWTGARWPLIAGKP